LEIHFFDAVDRLFLIAGVIVLTLRSLQVFLAIAEYGSMTKAAEKLFISQPSVSLAVSEIEKTYNVVLFDRLPGRLRLTPTGEKLRRYAQRILEVERDMEQFLAQESENYCVKIGATVTVGGSVVSSIIAQMKTEIPKINYHVDIANTRVIEEKLMDGELDIALVEGEIGNPSLEIKSFMDDKLVLICSERHMFAGRDAVSIKELSGVPLVLREPQSGTREQFEQAIRKSGIDAVVRFSSVSYGAIIDAVEHDLGVGIISERLIRKHAESGAIHVCDISDADLSRTFKLVYRRDKYITEILDQFIRICRGSDSLRGDLTML